MSDRLKSDESAATVQAFADPLNFNRKQKKMEKGIKNNPR